MPKLPRRPTLDSIDPVRRDRAFQMDMLAIDEEFGAQWLHTMRALIAEELDAADFTAKRMTALHEWTRERKRRQAQLNWKYDRTGKRRPNLVERDIERTWATLEKRTEHLKAQLEERAAQLAAKRSEEQKRTARIRSGMRATADTLGEIHEKQHADRVEEARRLQERASDLIRQKMALLPGTEITGEHINLFLNMTRDQMTSQERALFLRTIQGDIS